MTIVRFMRQKRQPLRKDSKTAQVLLELDKLSDWWMLSSTNQTLVLKYGYEGARNILDAKARKREREALRRLAEMQLIQLEKIAKTYEVNLTLIGAQELFRLKVLNSEMLPPHISCFVIFDIPERHRKLRNELRSFLRYAGFRCMQKSVWFSDRDVFDPITMLFAINGMRTKDDWIQVYKAERQI